MSVENRYIVGQHCEQHGNPIPLGTLDTAAVHVQRRAENKIIGLAIVARLSGVIAQEVTAAVRYFSRLFVK